MSILIKGMGMPTSCRACMFSRTDIRNIDWCVLTGKDLPCDCPIVPVPPHGRLIDADAFAEEMKRRQTAAEDWRRDALEANDEEISIRADAVLSFLCEVKLTMDKMLTIIEAEGEECTS